jgi:aminomethyltransferase
MASINASKAETGTELEVEVRGRRVAATIVPMPFYKRA